MKKIILNYRLLLILILGSFTLSSCLLDDEVTDFGKGPVVVQFEALETAGLFLQTEDNTVYTYDIPVAAFGGNGLALDRDIELTVSASDESTAKEGRDYEFVSNSLTISAGKLVGNVQIKVYSENLDASNPVKLVLQIDSSSETVSDKNKTVVVLQAICPSELAGDYVYTDGNQVDATIESTGVGTYKLSRDNAFNASFYIEFSDVCGNLTITGGAIESFGIAVSGDGSVDSDTGTITLNYTVDGYFTNRTMTLVKK